MVLLFDVGNTHTTVALTRNGKEFEKYRLSTVRYETEDELYAFLKSFYKEYIENIPVVVSSVVPSMNVIFEYFAEKYGNGQVHFVSALRYDKIKWNVSYPKEIGADRVADVIAAHKDYGGNCIIIDYGTAITIEVIKDGSYEGGVILPGFAMMINALFKGTAKLPLVEIKPCKGFIGKDTESNIQIGTINATVGAIKYVIENIVREFQSQPIIIHTGGQSVFVKDIVEGIIDKDLTLKGMYYFYEETKNSSR